MADSSSWSDLVKAAGAPVEQLKRADIGINSPKDLRDLVRATDVVQLRELFERRLSPVQLARLKTLVTGAAPLSAAARARRGAAPHCAPRRHTILTHEQRRG